MRGGRRWIGWAGLSLVLASGCSILLGEDKAFHEVDGTGGVGSASSTTAGGAITSASSTSSTTAASSSASSMSVASSSAGASTSSSGGGPCGIGHLVISEIRTRGLNGPADEFIELYNPSDTPIVLDSEWTIQARSTSSLTYSQRWAGSGKTIPEYGHYLIAGSSYVQSPPSDDSLSQAIPDTASVVLQLDSAPVSVVCFYYDAASLDILQNGGYDCDDMPVENPHDDTNDSNLDASIERKPGGTAGNCTNSGDDLVDFTISSPATPLDTNSAPTP
jgi:hypothetical protein